jgi:hypothetical protein
MNSYELYDLGCLLQSIAHGEEWECEWAKGGWGPPLGRDVEYCLFNRIPIRLKEIAETVTKDEPIDNGGPIAPNMVSQTEVNPHVISESRVKAEGGLTKREYFAGLALQGYLAGRENPTREMQAGDKHHAGVAAACYRYADALLAARKEQA